MVAVKHTRHVLGPLLLLVYFAAACGSSTSRGPTGSPTPTPRQRLDAAAARLQSVDAFHFLLSHQNGASTIAEGLQMTRAEGDFVRPDRFSARVSASFQGLPVSVKVINVGDKTWITNPLQSGDHYQALPNGPQTTAILDPNGGIIAAARAMPDPRLTGMDRLGNVDAFVVQGAIDAGSLQAIATDAEVGRQVPTRVWIGKDDGLIYRVRIDGQLSASEPKNIVRQVDISGFNQKVSIEPPG